MFLVQKFWAKILILLILPKIIKCTERW